MAIISFDGARKCILITFESGETDVTLDIKADLYSKWKEWVLESDNSKYLRGMVAIGGQPKGGSKFVGSTFFMVNDWVLCPNPFEEGNSTLTVVGELLSEDGIKSIITFDDVTSNKNLNFVRDIPISSEIQIVEVGGSGLTEEESIALFLADDKIVSTQKDIRNLKSLILGLYGK